MLSDAGEVCGVTRGAPLAISTSVCTAFIESSSTSCIFGFAATEACWLMMEAASPADRQLLAPGQVTINASHRTLIVRLGSEFYIWCLLGWWVVEQELL